MKRTRNLIRSIALIAVALMVASLSHSQDEKKWDEPPSVTKSVAPQNPNKIAGMVSANVVIDESGQVESATIHKSTDNALDEYVLSSVKQWRFAPAKLDGKAIKATIRVPFKFES